MNNRLSALFAWFLCGCALALLVGYIPLRAAVHQATFMSVTTLSSDAIAELRMSPPELLQDILINITALVFSLLGVLIITRQPGNRVGWIFYGIGFAFLLSEFAEYYAVYSLVLTDGALPGGLAMGWLQSWLWLVLWGLLFVFLPLLYPNGQPLSRAWRIVTWFAAANLAVLILCVMFLLTPLTNELQSFAIPNPLALQGPISDAILIIVPIVVLWLATILASALSVLLRLHRSQRVERQQVKWFAYLAAASCVFIIPDFLINSGVIASPVPDDLRTIPVSILFLALPIATGLAILRYRLWDIDIIIRKTLTYTLLTGILGVVFIGSTIALQQIFSALTHSGQNEIVTVISTLVIAALFVPLRHRVQNVIDKRFYRKKYDAQQVLAKFAETVRDETNLEKLTNELVNVVQETMQPSSVSVWLKKEGRSNSK